MEASEIVTDLAVLALDSKGAYLPLLMKTVSNKRFISWIKIRISFFKKEGVEGAEQSFSRYAGSIFERKRKDAPFDSTYHQPEVDASFFPE